MDPINQPQPPIQPKTPPPPTPNSKLGFLKSVKVWLVVVLLVLLIPTTAYVLSKNQTKPVTIIQYSPTPTPDPTANWKTYNDSSGLFSFKYPLETLVQENSKETAAILEEKPLISNLTISTEKPRNNIQIGVRDNTNGVNLEDALGNGPLYYYINDVLKGKNIQKINIDGTSALIVNSIPTGPGDALMTEVVSIKDNKIYQIVFPYDWGNYSLSQQILSTFKFTNQTSNYFNVSELGIKIKITDDIKDLNYLIKTIDNSQTAYFTTNSLIAEAKSAGGINYCTSDGPIGAISKISKSSLSNSPDARWDETLSGLRAETIGKNGNPPFAKELDDSFIFFSHPQATCSDNKYVQTLQTNQINSLWKTIQTSEIIK